MRGKIYATRLENIVLEFISQLRIKNALYFNHLDDFGRLGWRSIIFRKSHLPKRNVTMK